MTNRIYKLGLEEKGQDFKTLYVQGGVIIKGGPRLTYGVEHVEIYEAEISYGDWLKEIDKMALHSLDEPDYTRREVAMTRNDPWVAMYLRETVLVATLAREAMLQEA